MNKLKLAVNPKCVCAISIVTLVTFVIFQTIEERHPILWEIEANTSSRSFLERQPNNVAESNWDLPVKKIEQIANRIPSNGGSSVPLWDLIHPNFTCPFAIERIGRIGDGGKWVCGFEENLSTKSACLIYSLGIRDETSFEEEILQRSSNCTVRMFDHTIGRPPSLVEKYPGRAFWYPFGISGDDQTWNLRTLRTLMDTNQDELIDILKMDVECSEWEALKRILKDFTVGPLPFSQLLVEIHFFKVPETERPKMLLSLSKSLEDVGLRLFKSELNIWGVPYCCSEYSFLNIKVEPFKL